MKKLIIFSENKVQSTSKIVRWINFYNYDVVRINIDDKELDVLKFHSNCLKLQTSNGYVDIMIDDIVWFRRFSSSTSFFLKGSSSNYEDSLKMFEFHEKSNVFLSFIHFIRLKCKVICDPVFLSVNKTHVLLEAEKIGITCPQWLITNNRKELTAFFQKHELIVNKTFNQFSFYSNKNYSKVLASLLTKDDLDKIPNTFNSGFFQRYIPKKYELRIFFFENTFFSMAIFSQNDEQTKVDFRNYNRKKPNRSIPVTIPENYKKKLIELAKKLSLQSGSFDVLVTDDDKYYFLEVNPIGQFGMVSFPCNYQIEKFIAESLIQKIDNSFKNEKAFVIQRPHD